jgi:hypothetical protein
MLTDLKLVLEFSHVPNNMCLTINDRDQLIAKILSIDEFDGNKISHEDKLR